MAWPNVGFVANDEIARAVDAALLGLQNGAERIARKAMKIVLEGKSENPMTCPPP